MCTDRAGESPGVDIGYPGPSKFFYITSYVRSVAFGMRKHKPPKPQKSAGRPRLMWGQTLGTSFRPRSARVLMGGADLLAVVAGSSSISSSG